MLVSARRAALSVNVNMNTFNTRPEHYSLGIRELVGIIVGLMGWVV